MKIFKAIIIVGFLALCGAAAFHTAGIAHADTTDNCNLTTSDIAQIAAIQNDPNLSALDEVKQELAVRKSLVGQTITCAQADVTSLQTSLDNATTTDTASANLKDQLSNKLDDAENFYSLQLTKLNGTGIAGSEAIAQEVLAWRAGSYEPLRGEVNDFILWSGNQGLFATANNRMQQTAQAVSFLEGTSGNTDLAAAFATAQTSFNAAQQENNAAENALTQFLPPEQSLVLIKQSLDSLSLTYKNFFAVTSVINTLLPQ
jgi:hypothetical protein